MHGKQFFCFANAVLPLQDNIWIIWHGMWWPAGWRTAHSEEFPGQWGICCCIWAIVKVRYLKFWFPWWVVGLPASVCWLTAKMLQRSLCTVEGKRETLIGFDERAQTPFSASMFVHCKLCQLQLGQAVHYWFFGLWLHVQCGSTVCCLSLGCLGPFKFCCFALNLQYSRIQVPSNL